MDLEQYSFDKINYIKTVLLSTNLHGFWIIYKTTLYKEKLWNNALQSVQWCYFVLNINSDQK